MRDGGMEAFSLPGLMLSPSRLLLQFPSLVVSGEEEVGMGSKTVCVSHVGGTHVAAIGV